MVAERGDLGTVETHRTVDLEPILTGVSLAAQPRAASTSTVRQGFLENANTSSVSEMANLISAMRFFEANQKVIQTEDDRVGRLISDVANPA